LVRLFYANDRPVILAKNIIPAVFLREPFEQVDGQLHISEILMRYCHQNIAFAITEIHSVAVGEEVHDLLGKELGQPVLALNVAFYSKHNLPLALGINFFNDDILRLNLVQAWS
jgi:DNA-binding GntR family transcriptional regulator